MVSVNTAIGLGQRVRKVTPATTVFHYEHTGKLIAEAATQLARPPQNGQALDLAERIHFCL